MKRKPTLRGTNRRTARKAVSTKSVMVEIVGSGRYNPESDPKLKDFKHKMGSLAEIAF